MAFVQPGEQAPDFTVLTDSGETVKLSDFRGKKVILYFYPKADTPGCTIQACAIRDNYDKYNAFDVVILGASPDTVEEQAAFKSKFDLPFILLADADHSIADDYGAWGDHTVTRNGEEKSYTGILRSTWVLDEDGRVIDAKFGVDPANDTAELLAYLEEQA